MKIITLRVGQLDANCYLISDNGEVAIIDPGDDGDFIIQHIEKEKLKPVWVLATHGHFDHVLAATEVSLAYSIPFYIHPEDMLLLGSAHKSAEHFTKAKMEPVAITPHFVKNGSKLKVGKVELEVLETPGHTPGGICLYSKSEKILFSGDTIFKQGIIGRTDFAYASEKDMDDSLEKILKLPEDTVVYPGHGRETTLEEFKNLYFSHKKTRT